MQRTQKGQEEIVPRYFPTPHAGGFRPWSSSTPKKTASWYTNPGCTTARASSWELPTWSPSNQKPRPSASAGGRSPSAPRSRPRRSTSTKLSCERGPRSWPAAPRSDSQGCPSHPAGARPPSRERFGSKRRNWRYERGAQGHLRPELELGLIQSHMTQKPMLRPD